jgi:hypothetical protein
MSDNIVVLSIGLSKTDETITMETKTIVIAKFIGNFYENIHPELVLWGSFTVMQNLCRMIVIVVYSGKQIAHFLFCLRSL